MYMKVSRAKVLETSCHDSNEVNLTMITINEVNLQSEMVYTEGELSTAHYRTELGDVTLYSRMAVIQTYLRCISTFSQQNDSWSHAKVVHIACI